jgi:hypothetical protein
VWTLYIISRGICNTLKTFTSKGCRVINLIFKTAVIKSVKMRFVCFFKCKTSSWLLTLPITLPYYTYIPNTYILYTLPIYYILYTLPYLTLPYLTLPYYLYTITYIPIPYLTLPYLTSTPHQIHLYLYI